MKEDLPLPVEVYMQLAHNLKLPQFDEGERKLMRIGQVELLRTMQEQEKISLADHISHTPLPKQREWKIRR